MLSLGKANLIQHNDGRGNKKQSRRAQQQAGYTSGKGSLWLCLVAGGWHQGCAEMRTWKQEGEMPKGREAVGLARLLG